MTRPAERSCIENQKCCSPLTMRHVGVLKKEKARKKKRQISSVATSALFWKCSNFRRPCSCAADLQTPVCALSNPSTVTADGNLIWLFGRKLFQQTHQSMSLRVLISANPSSLFPSAAVTCLFSLVCALVLAYLDKRAERILDKEEGSTGRNGTIRPPSYLL